MRYSIIVLFVLFSFIVELRAQARVGMVIAITGTARVKGDDGEERKLNSYNFAIPLFAGQSLKADGRGSVQIKLCNGQTVTVTTKWYRVSQRICSKPTDLEKRKILESVFEFGGRYKVNRGSDAFILFPLESNLSTVRPETAVFRWISTTGQLVLRLDVVGQNKPSWSLIVSGDSGSYSSAELTRVLKGLRETFPTATIRLGISHTSLGTENHADFQVLSSSDEISLQNELSQTDSDQSLFRFLVRTEIFSRYKLYVDAAREYENALKLSPESVELLMATSSAQDRVGNLRRRDELRSFANGLKK